MGKSLIHPIHGKPVLDQLSIQLTKKYGKGFSVANLKNFRQFYQIFHDRLIRHPVGSELLDDPKRYPPGSESEFQSQPVSTKDAAYSEFQSNLNWSHLHYRTLMEKRG
jgi:hypothetical protein